MAKCQLGKKTALLVGCNYPNTSHELRGCHNDVGSMYATLTTVYGFDPRKIEVLMDKPGTKPNAMPTGANIRSALLRLVSQLRAGDLLFFFFSGHGTAFSFPKCPGEVVEAIVPCDYNIITNVDFRRLVNRVPQGATFTFLADSGHSGGLIYKEKEQIGPNTQTSFRNGKVQPFYGTPKSISYGPLLEILSSGGGLTNTPRDIETIMLQKFGSEASLLFTLPANELRELVLKPDEGILLSGCQPDELGLDMRIGVGKYDYLGSFNNAVQRIIHEKLLARPFTNKQLVMKAREIFPHPELHPCLYCSDKNVNQFFLNDAKN